MKLRILTVAFMAALFLTLIAPTGERVSASHFCPDDSVALISTRASAGSQDDGTIDISAGLGYFEAWEGGLVDFSGTFVYRNSMGQVVRQGTWTAEKLIVWKPYGCSEEFDYEFGGRAIFRVRLVDQNGVEAVGILDLESPKGHNAPSTAVEGIRVSVKGWNLRFLQPNGGSVWIGTI